MGHNFVLWARSIPYIFDIIGSLARFIVIGWGIFWLIYKVNKHSIKHNRRIHTFFNKTKQILFGIIFPTLFFYSWYVGNIFFHSIFVHHSKNLTYLLFNSVVIVGDAIAATWDFHKNKVRMIKKMDYNLYLEKQSNEIIKCTVLHKIEIIAHHFKRISDTNNIPYYTVYPVNKNPYPFLVFSTGSFIKIEDPTNITEVTEKYSISFVNATVNSIVKQEKFFIRYEFIIDKDDLRKPLRFKFPFEKGDSKILIIAENFILDDITNNNIIIEGGEGENKEESIALHIPGNGLNYHKVSENKHSMSIYEATVIGLNGFLTIDLTNAIKNALEPKNDSRKKQT